MRKKFKETMEANNKQRLLEEQFEVLRVELNQFVDSDGYFLDKDRMLELSQKIDKLHTEYMKLKLEKKETV
ncbi:hypothetical protein BHU72_07905 [Desulfuribacillus stibiiarsenatis]|uniref:Uncharacterized protein n=1 Tax=Desulfuribacillus stibiiarsenatis TaxID=1390249 RepID=A0A1E5L3M5_9FIRM|nr:Spo0E family sporulation regulatory protein-aspartic acid phosphatase [Desulfuribacillus stibiiarsenatis]OEH84748.1 hypothetical protein BHU72_07905 [Desulfuribacillus stibiiarsenatis]